jgi:hypothetical protein
MKRSLFRTGTSSLAILAALLAGGCGGSGDTTVINNTTTTTVASGETTSTTASTTTASTTTSATDDSGGVAAGPVLSLQSFRSPTGNIACLMSGRSVRCDISERSWSPPQRPADCPSEVDFGQGLELPASGAARFVCAGDTVLGDTSAQVLDYGSSSRIGSITCTSAESGMQCANESGGSFSLSREEYVLN